MCASLRLLWVALILGLRLATPGQANSQPAYQWHNVTSGGGGFAPAIIFSRTERNLAYLRTDIGSIYRWGPPHPAERAN